MYDTGEGVSRGHHAHRSLEQILICIHGSCKILLDNGEEKRSFHWKSHMRDFTLKMISGERCMISLPMQC